MKSGTFYNRSRYILGTRQDCIILYGQAGFDTPNPAFKTYRKDENVGIRYERYLNI